MKARIYHNPRCSKSRQTLQLLKEKGVEPEIIEYLKTPPDAREICDLCRRMGIAPRELVRFKEGEARELGITKKSELPDEEWCRLMAEHPKLIERPIVVHGDRVLLGRPPEKVLEIL
ncbi:MAG: arsenate reductase (glutaredoxin) [Calditrichaeota bacterium]|nr:MAG: arsenate reductase (glutaredoxin) [Calditrichota bacterium]